MTTDAGGGIGRRTVVLDTLEPAAPLDDLEPLRGIVADARVVGVGEGAHFVREFGLARARLIRFLVERCGFTSVAFEMGDGEAAAVNPWLAGDGDERDLADLAGVHTVGLFGTLLLELRRLNRGWERPVQIIGVDLPNTLNLRPDLEPFAAYVREVDPDMGGLVGEVLATAGEVTGASAAASAPQWGALDAARRESLTAGLARLSLRFAALEPLHVARSDQGRYDVAKRHLDAACHTDYMLRSMHALFTGSGLADDTSIRDHYMARCVRWHLDRLGPEARMVLVAHNNHVQKTLVTYDGYPTALPAGYHLARSLGAGYRVVGMTHTAGQMPEMDFPAADSPVGFNVVPFPVEAPPPGSIEHALVEAGFGAAVGLTDLRSPDAAVAALHRMRAQSATMDVPVADAFDAVLTTPAATMERPGGSTDPG